MKTVIRFGGTIESFALDSNTLTTDIKTAKKFDSIEDAKSFYCTMDFSFMQGVSIRDAETNTFLKWLNW